MNFFGVVDPFVMTSSAGSPRPALVAAQPELHRAASKGVLHGNTASRKISRLAQRVKALSA